MSLVVGYDTEHDSDEALAGRLLRTLCDAYSGHAWFITIRGGIIQVKDLDIHPNWGMSLHYTQVNHDAAVMKREVIRAAGEFLERANLARGRKTEEKVKHVDGIPDKHMVRAGL